MAWKHRDIEITINNYGVFRCEVGEAKLNAKTLEEPHD